VKENKKEGDESPFVIVSIFVWQIIKISASLFSPIGMG
jgi:hypothetical protein